MARWSDDETTVLTFEGDAIRGRLARSEKGDGTSRVTRPVPFFGPDQLPGYADLCRGNIAALLTGATPAYYSYAVPDGTVNGLALSVRRPGGASTSRSHAR